MNWKLKIIKALKWLIRFKEPGVHYKDLDIREKANIRKVTIETTMDSHELQDLERGLLERDGTPDACRALLKKLLSEKLAEELVKSGYATFRQIDEPRQVTVQVHILAIMP